ncbi:hypothetical protein JVU11DRAFT_10283 [Chiua virens]|nr:hypothetical protein JVU11DRAFT_10283 [Chiua virens]
MDTVFFFKKKKGRGRVSEGELGDKIAANWPIDCRIPFSHILDKNMSIIKGVALITGSAQGIGRAIALRLAKDGFDIALNDFGSKCDQLRAVAEDIEKLGRRASVVPGDVTIEQEVKEMVQDVARELGSLDVMVANAGICPRLTSLVTAELDDWDWIMAVNARGPFLCYKYAAQQMIEQGRGGRIIGASSVDGRRGLASLAAYSTSKFAVRGLTQSAAMELGRYNITVNSYAPGPVDTPMSNALRDVVLSDPVIMETLMGSAPKGVIKHQAQPEDVAGLVSYLASKEAYLITGSNQDNA